MASVTGLWDAESIVFNRGRSTGRGFHSAQRPLNGHPPSFNNEHTVKQLPLSRTDIQSSVDCERVHEQIE